MQRRGAEGRAAPRREAQPRPWRIRRISSQILCGFVVGAGVWASAKLLTRAVPRLRVLGLPDEYYCPYAERVRVEAPAGEPAVLRADVTIGRVSYACRSVHGHGVNHAMVERVVKDSPTRGALT